MIGLSLVVTGIAMASVQAGLTGRIVKRVGEVPAAMTGLMIAAAACFAYAFAPYGWMVFVITTVGALQSIAYPALNALMTRQIPADAQGELQGGIASLASLANIVGPLVMTQTLAYFTAPGAPVYFPGAAFVLAALLQLAGFALLVWKRPASHATEREAVVERA
jgi:DHA1 family tetracycline resistance protein-like MFS transporter